MERASDFETTAAYFGSFDWVLAPVDPQDDAVSRANWTLRCQPSGHDVVFDSVAAVWDWWAQWAVQHILDARAAVTLMALYDESDSRARLALESWARGDRILLSPPALVALHCMRLTDDERARWKETVRDLHPSSWLPDSGRAHIRADLQRLIADHARSHLAGMLPIALRRQVVGRL